MIIRGLPPHLSLGYLNVEPVGDGLRECNNCHYLPVKGFVCTCGHKLCADCISFMDTPGEGLCSTCQSVVGYQELELKEAFLRLLKLRCSCSLTGTIEELRQHLPCPQAGLDLNSTTEDNRANLINERLDRIQKSVQVLHVAQRISGDSKINLWIHLSELIEQHAPSGKPQHRTFTRLLDGYDLRIVAQVTAVQGVPYLGLMISSRAGDPMEDRSTAPWPIKAKVTFRLYDREGAVVKSSAFKTITDAQLVSEIFRSPASYPSQSWGFRTFMAISDIMSNDVAIIVGGFAQFSVELQRLELT